MKNEGKMAQDIFIQTQTYLKAKHQNNIESQRDKMSIKS